jgi:hypothetical protein
MEDHPAEVRVAVVPVGLPVGAAQMDLDVAAEASAVDDDLRAQEVGTGPAVPVAGMQDLDRRSGGGGHRAADFARSPQPLDGAFADGERAVRTVDFFDACAGAHARIHAEPSSLGKSGERPRGRHRIRLREDPSRR